MCGRVFFVMSALLMTACQEPTLAVQLVFPSELTFLHTAVARIDVYDGSGTGERSPDAICRSLSTNPPAPPSGVQPIATSGSANACQFADGGVVLEHVGVGRRVILVEGEDFDGAAIVRGCTVVDVFGDDAPATDDATPAVITELGANAAVTVPLAILPAFPAGDAGCTSMTEKCEEDVSCRP
jgi:hypothetical protein